MESIKRDEGEILEDEVEEQDDNCIQKSKTRTYKRVETDKRKKDNMKPRTQKQIEATQRMVDARKKRLEDKKVIVKKDTIKTNIQNVLEDEIQEIQEIKQPIRKQTIRKQPIRKQPTIVYYESSEEEEEPQQEIIVKKINKNKPKNNQVVLKEPTKKPNSRHSLMVNMGF